MSYTKNDWTDILPAAVKAKLDINETGTKYVNDERDKETAPGRALVEAADAAAQRTALGLGDSATKSVGTTAGTVAAGDDARLPTANEKTRLSDIQAATGATTALKLANLTSPASPTQQGVALLGASGGAAKLTKMPDGATATVSRASFMDTTGLVAEGTPASTLSVVGGVLRVAWSGSTINRVYVSDAGSVSAKIAVCRVRANRAGLIIHGYNYVSTAPIGTFVLGIDWQIIKFYMPIGSAKFGLLEQLPNCISGDYFEVEWLWVGDYSYLPGSLSEEAARIANLRGDVSATGQFASQTITATDLATATKGDTIGGKKYTYVAALTASPGVEGEILKEATKEAELENLNLAISEAARTNNGVKYWAAAVHPLVSSARVNAVLTLTAKTNNGSENTITVVCESGTNHTAGGATLVGGYTDSAAKTIAEVQNNIAGSGTRPAAAKTELTNTALIGYEDEVDKAVGATLTFPAGGVWIWFVHGYGSLVGGLKKGSSSGGATITMAGANGSIWYRKYS